MCTLLVSNTIKWTVHVHVPKNVPVAKVLSKVDNWALICKGHFISTNKREQWTESLVSRKRKRLEETVYKLTDRLLPNKQSDANQLNGFAQSTEQTGKTNFNLALKKMEIVLKMVVVNILVG